MHSEVFSPPLLLHSLGVQPKQGFYEALMKLYIVADIPKANSSSDIDLITDSRRVMERCRQNGSTIVSEGMYSKLLAVCFNQRDAKRLFETVQVSQCSGV
jgi:hypothetical protein